MPFLIYRKKWLFLFSMLVGTARALAQTDSSGQLKEVVVTGFRNALVTQSVLNIQPYPLRKLESSGPENLSDALAKIPGVSQMTTGVAISKPVVRGLYGSRVLVLLSGLRFDNQQWQDEHGLGLSQIGIDRVELIKGPASLLYGTDAMGGVINIIEPIPSRNQDVFDAKVRLYSNTIGTLTDAGYTHYRSGGWWRVRGGYENHADYKDGNGNIVSNSRNKGYYFKAGAGFDHTHWSMHNSYNFSYNKYGFILDSNKNALPDDSRNSRAMSGPHHNVMLHVLGSENNFYLRRKNTDADLTSGSILKLNLGVQSNRRVEDEGGGEISLDMHLLTIPEQLRWEKNLNRNMTLVFCQQFTYTINANLGKRTLVPDAQMHEENLSALVHWSPWTKLVLEAGIGLTNKNIQTYRTGSLNAPGKEIQPFQIKRTTGNAMAGLSFQPSSSAVFKWNAATGTRAPNLAELASGGLHEGSYRYEIGNAGLKAEQNLNLDFDAEYTRNRLYLSGSIFYNRIYNYIYLGPTSEYYYGFPVFRYFQQNARLYGGEFEARYLLTDFLSVKESFCIVKGETDDAGNLPFIAPARNVAAIRFERNFHGGISQAYAEPQIEYDFAQNQPAPFETATPDYALLHFSAGLVTSIGRHPLQLDLSCRNLLNKAYYDHLSRLKYFGLYNQGINIVFSASTQLNIKHKNQSNN